jgi:hypothetical protein
MTPLGLQSIIRLITVQFITYRAKPSKKRPNPAIRYRHNERMLAWRPRELQEFWGRFINRSDV